MNVELQPLNIGSIARGAALELFEKAVTAVAANIADTSTSATASREIVLKFKMKPEHDRRTVRITTSSKVGLAPVAEHQSTAYIGKDDAGHAYVLDQDPRQEMLFAPPPAPDARVLEFNTGTTANK